MLVSEGLDGAVEALLEVFSSLDMWVPIGWLLGEGEGVK